MRTRCPRQACGRGFTLVEVLVAIGILALGMSGVLSMFFFAARSHRRAIDNIEIGLLANELMTQYAAVLDKSTDESGALNPASALDTKNVVGHRIIGSAGQPNPRFPDDGFVVSANYPRFWYSVILRDIPETDAPTIGNAVRMVVKITRYPGSPSADGEVRRFETVLLRKPLVSAQ